MALLTWTTTGTDSTTAKYDIKPESAPTLEQVASLLLQHEDLSLRIEGHLADDGAVRYGLKLCERRAKAVME